jgi:hypothetical protein
MTRKRVLMRCPGIRLTGSAHGRQVVVVWSVIYMSISKSISISIYYYISTVKYIDRYIGLPASCGSSRTLDLVGTCVYLYMHPTK